MLIDDIDEWDKEESLFGDDDDFDLDDPFADRELSDDDLLDDFGDDEDVDDMNKNED